MNLQVKRLTIALAALGLVVVTALLVIPLFVDVNRYRGVIEARAEQALGREITLGEMGLTLFPRVAVRVDRLTVGGLPGEAGDLLTAERLRVGARLIPLIRQRLEVTQIVVVEPRLALVRGGDGRWNVERLIAGEAGPSGAEQPDESSVPPSFRIDDLRLTGGRLELRDESRPGEPLVATLTDLDLRLSDVRPDGPIGFEMSTRWEQVPQARVRVAGRAGPLFPPGGGSTRVEADAEVEHVDIGRLEPLFAAFLPMPAGLVAGDDVTLSAKLEATTGPGARIALQDVVVDGLVVSLRQGPDGSWNLPRPAGATGGPEGGSASRDSATGFGLSNLELRDVELAIDGELLPGRRLALTIDDLDARVDRLPTEGPARLTVEAEVAGTGRMTAAGQLGPLARAGGALPLTLDLSFDPVPPVLVGLIEGDGFRLDGGSGRATLALRLTGTFPESLSARGELELSGYNATLATPDGTTRTIPLSLRADYDATVRGVGETVEIDRLDLDFSGNELSLRGSIAEAGAAHRVDLTLSPTEIAADDLATLAGMLAGKLPIAFESDRPIALEARIEGLVGDGRVPELHGTVELRQFRFMHESLEKPVENVGARITMLGETIRVDDLTGVVGSSDFAGRVSIEGFRAPRIAFELRSNYADFGELFSFLDPGPAETDSDAGRAADEADDPLSAATIAGDIRIERGLFDTLEFDGLQAHMTWADGVLTLDPVDLRLYDGAFRGDVIGDLGGAQPVFEIRGQARQIDIDRFLADNLGSAGMLYGKFSGTVETRTSGADYTSIIRHLTGAGTVEVAEGRVAGLDLLRTLSRVSGLFGEQTISQLGGRLATEGTAFDAMSGGVRFDGGKMRFDGLLLDSPDFRLTGVGDVDLLGAVLDGDFELSMSPELSASMRAEKSRAAQLFWNASESRVELPFSLEGPFTAPSPRVDWNAVAETAIKGR
ncbi:MAG TPA: AsmA family protein, partial [Candidatus Polarisedimenticolaceae bacterium]|nr:AsmA family protein [Candidatus Polarisedimenticolaceae bacterium]